MAIFGKKENTKAKAKKAPAAAVSSAPVAVRTSGTSAKHSGSVLLSPRITEKSAYMGEASVYAFNVSRNANKQEIARAIAEVFKVIPVQVRIVPVRGKKVMSRRTGVRGRTASGKKAYVFLKKGDKIDLL